MAIRKPSIRNLSAYEGRRVNRRPQHTFLIEQRPWEIMPFFIAPVLPGETMQYLQFQSRCVTSPVRNHLQGWWLEHFFFYVKHRDLDARDVLTQMMLDPSTDVSTLRSSSANRALYTFDDGMDWVRLCLKRITEEYFRDEGEAWDAYTISSGIPAKRINQDGWWQSVVDRTAILDDLDIGIQTEADVDPVTGGDQPGIMASDIDRALMHYQFLREQGLTNQSYEDYLATFGVKPSRVELHRPELLRYLREWQYPANTVDPSSGIPRSAVVWSVGERADKARYFTEPGFIVGVTSVHPKVYYDKMTGAGVGMLDDVYAWLPAVMADDPRTSLKEFATSEGPLQSTTNPYVVDVKDLFIHGDQYMNFDPAQTDHPNPITVSDVPNNALTNKRYPTATDADGCFVSTSGHAEYVYQEGIVTLSISGRQVDTTPGPVGQ